MTPRKRTALVLVFGLVAVLEVLFVSVGMDTRLGAAAGLGGLVIGSAAAFYATGGHFFG